MNRGGMIEGLAVVSLFSAVVPEAAHAQTVFHACYVPATGIVYRTDQADECKGQSHVPFSWTDGEGAIRSGDAASGDLVGTYPDPTVAKLQTKPVSAALPSDGDVLAWDGTAWRPTAPSDGASPWAGYETSTVTFHEDYAAGEVKGLGGWAVCPADKVVIGGGYDMLVAFPFTPVRLVGVIANLPDNAQEWKTLLMIHNTGGSTTTVGITVSAICVNGP